MKAASSLSVAPLNENEKENEITEEVVNDRKEHLGSIKFSFSNISFESDSDDEPNERTFATRQLLNKLTLKVFHRTKC